MQRLLWMEYQKRTQGSAPTVSGQKRTTENLFSSSQPPGHPQAGGFFMGIGMRIEVGRRCGLFADY